MKNDYDAQMHSRDPIVQDSGGLRWMSVLVMVLVVFGFFSLVWYAYHASHMQESRQEALQVIAPEKTMYKQKPESAGGLDVAHKDIEAYQLMRNSPTGEEEAANVERLLPASDVPLPRPNIQPDPMRDAEMRKIEQAEQTGARPILNPAAPIASEPEILISQRNMQVETYRKPTEATSVNVEPSPPVAKAPVAPKVVAPKPAVPAPKAPVAKAPQPSVARSKAYVQLAALSSEAEARRMWQKKSAQHSDLLGSYSYYTEPVRVSGKGTMIRLRIKGFGSLSEAQQLCQRLKSRGQDCLVSSN